MTTKLISILALTISISYGFTCGKHSNLPLLSNTALITSDSVVCYPLHYVSLNHTTKEANYTVQYTTFEESRRGLERNDNFQVDINLREYQFSDGCYYKSDFDKGHLTPYRLSDWSTEASDNSFLMTNIVPMYPYFNRYMWMYVENYIYKLLEIYNEGYIVTGQILSYKKVSNCSMSLASHFYKAFYDKDFKYISGVVVPHHIDKNFKYEPLSNYELNEVQFRNITGLYISN